MGITVACFGLGRLQSQFRTQGTSDPLRRVVTVATDPIALSVGHALDANARFWKGVSASGELVKENERLKATESAWALYSERVSALEQQLDDIRSLQKLPPLPGRERITAEVVNFEPHASRMTITVGSANGVKVGQAVATPQGLLGVIQTVDSSRSQVLLLNSPSIRIGAMVNKRPPIAGLARGMGNDRMLLGFLEGASAAIGPGDQVVTSIHSEHIPPYIKIGEVIRTQAQPEYGLLEIQVLLAVQPAEVRTVVVYQ